jgi:formamidopyrimidine-DNA glycosylase
MPELPEVETTRRGLVPHLVGKRIDSVLVRDARLRWPIEDDLRTKLAGQLILQLGRRAKYLIIELERGALIVHLGMSGALSVVTVATSPGKHDHVDIGLTDGQALRLTDPRRFGSLHYVTGDPSSHPLLASLGPEPLSETFDARAIHGMSRKRKVAIKAFLMNARVVAGVGNIYANEALFRAGIDPRLAAGRISLARYERLIQAVRATLIDALSAGGSSLRDWHQADGSLGYFQQQYFVYGRGGETCKLCGTIIREVRQAQRATYFCARCQKR